MSLLKPIRLLKTIHNEAPKSNKMPLHLVFVVPFVLQIFGAVGLVGYLSFRNSQQAVNDLANQLMGRVCNLVDQRLDALLTTPHQINKINLDAISSGLLDVKNIRSMERVFWKQMQVFNFGYINYGNQKGEFVGVSFDRDNNPIIEVFNRSISNKLYTYATDNKGNRKQLTAVGDFEFITQAWYADSVRAGKPVWSKIYHWGAGYEDVLSISCNYPVYDHTKTLIGVLGNDLTLSQLSDFLRNLKVSNSAKIFIAERNGLLVASSTPEKSLTKVGEKAQRINALDSHDPLIQSTAQYLQKKFGNFKKINESLELEFRLKGDRQFVQVAPWQDEFGLDWLVIVVVPETDFMEQINANTRITIVLCVVALLTATFLGMMTSRWITQPIRRLSEAASAIANGDLDQNVEVKGVNELGVLSRSFNQMAVQLKESFEQLETRVEQRTTELNEAKTAAEAANRAKSEFLANMSHELRTPLNAILGFTQIMNRDSALKPEQQENLGIINRSGEHLLSLINDVLDMSKIEAGRSELNKNDFDLYLLLDTIEEMFQLKADSIGLQIRIEISPEVPQYVRSDESKLRQILINLLGNAIKFTAVGDVILRVRGGETEQGENLTYILLFEVEDTGPGIAPDELVSLFEPFVQTETGRKFQQGTGLGLPISRKFVQLMGGDITLSSTLGQGTVFKFDIPVDLAQATNIQTEKPTRRVIGLEPGQPRYRILVVDDHWTNRRLLTKMLLPVGFEVCEAENGQEAIALWSSWEPHLIWMDMRMPMINGYEATQQIKSHLKGQATVIIALTASNFEEEREIILSAGCDDFLRKPFREEVIWEMMAQYLGVRYIYVATGFSAHQPVTEKLTSFALAVMPTEWVSQVYHAATQLNAELISELIAQIPEEYTSLATALQKKVNDFDFDQIMNLAQPISTL